MRALYGKNQTPKVTLVLDGLGGETPEDAFRAAFLRGSSFIQRNGLQAVADPSNEMGTAWEVTEIAKSVYLHKVDDDPDGRAWSSFRFYFKGQDVTTDMLAHEPDWIQLRKDAGLRVPPGM
ncbi:hypothetical protein KGQ19_37265 [Catenulispora sp. NL8]|uniref:Uncharacterized protein n=1 Tax=Catenulispora pinistramenti TaxID=2705254 RepID=A0ABS5L2N9_9ACTN|nr:hypothetical protein [Catenulispora pinistramenti]MBS2552520.1 hypothetical protein [Catenulispora pinistramenti]